MLKLSGCPSCCTYVYVVQVAKTVFTPQIHLKMWPWQRGQTLEAHDVRIPETRGHWRRTASSDDHEKEEREDYGHIKIVLFKALTSILHPSKLVINSHKPSSMKMNVWNHLRTLLFIQPSDQKTAFNGLGTIISSRHYIVLYTAWFTAHLRIMNMYLFSVTERTAVFVFIKNLEMVKWFSCLYQNIVGIYCFVHLFYFIVSVYTPQNWTRHFLSAWMEQNHLKLLRHYKYKR